MAKKSSKTSVKPEAADAAVDKAPVDPVAGKSVAEIFGEIVWLMSQDRQARELPIKDLEWLVMPPILLRQFHITYAPVPEGRTVKGEPVRPERMRVGPAVMQRPGRGCSQWQWSFMRCDQMQWRRRWTIHQIVTLS